VKGIGQRFIPIMVALLATGCGKVPRGNSAPKATYGQAACDYIQGSNQRNLGNFDIQLVQTRDPQLYALIITPVALARVGDLVTITIAGGAGDYRELISQAKLTVGRSLTAGIISVDDLDRYASIVIAVYQPGVNPLESTSPFLNICPLVQPGDGVTETAQ
jgi:hypothetical protein